MRARCAVIRVTCAPILMNTNTSESLTDVELSEQLDKLGYAHPPVTPTTRCVLERKLAQLSKKEVLPSLPSTTPEVIDPVVMVVNSSAQEEDKSKGCYLLLYSGDAPDGLTLKKCYYHKEELHGVLKVLKGARFKWFPTEQEAIAAYDNLQAEVQESTPPVTNKESASIYPSLSTVALNKFRKLIEDGKLEEFREHIWSNPRYLVSAGDAPELLKPSTRYNALHVATRCNKVEFCKEILTIIESMEFWKKLYPDDTQEARMKRKRHVIDLYLNMPDKIAIETPLHFACKYGYVDIVRLLLNRPEIDKSGRNSAGLTAREIICQNNRQGSVVKSIENLFEEVCFVPVYRSVDNSVPPVLGIPCSLEECHSPPQPNGSLSQSPVKPLLVGRAFAGPMSPTMAKDFRKRWRSPSKALESIKRSDPDKGMERVGRHLAYQDKTQWSEYWEFLGEFCDFAKPDGLEKLEQYLSGKFTHTAPEDVEDPLIDNLSSELSNISLASTPQKVFLTGPAPTKLDLSVMLALDEAGVDLSKYPKIQNWCSLINSYSQEDRTSWLTPKKSAQFYSPRVTPNTAGVTNYSPLIYRTPVVPISNSLSETIPSLDLNTSS